MTEIWASACRGICKFANNMSVVSFIAGICAVICLHVVWQGSGRLKTAGGRRGDFTGISLLVKEEAAASDVTFNLDTQVICDWLYALQ